MKNNIKKFLKNNKWVLLTLLVSSVIVSVIYTLQHIAPFGNNSMLDVDFYHQYGPLLNELTDRIRSEETLLYSFNTGGGIPFFRNFLNYLSSPFNIILLFFKKENIVMAFSVIIGLKAIVASATMSLYLKKTFKKDNFLTLIFGILYAFSGYFCAYYWNIMWLDGMVFLPIIMYGINKLIDQEKPLVYVLSLSLMLLANYFIGYMICIFSVLYFITYFIIKGNYKFKNILKKCVMFFISSVLAAGVVAFFLLPLYGALTTTSATNGGLPSQTFNFSIHNYLFNHISGVSRTVFASDALPLPNIYSGLITLVLIVLLFINKKIKLKYKVISLLALLFFYLCFNTAIIDYAWHAFHVPNDLPWRYSFLYVFTLITIAFYSITRIKDVKKMTISFSFAAIVIIILLSSKLEFVNITTEKVVTCVIFLACYYLIYLLSFAKPLSKKILVVVLIMLVSGEVIYAINSNWVIDHDIDSFMSDKKDNVSLINEIREYDNDLYRIEKADYLTLNDGAWYDYYGISTFTSMAYEDVSSFQRMIGLAGNNINSYYYRNYQTPVYNTMFNIKYILGNYIDNDYYTLLSSNDSTNLVKYEYNSSIAYAVNKSIKEWKLLSYMPFYNQNNFVNLSTGINNVYEDLKVTSVDNGRITSSNFIDNTNGEFMYELDDLTSENTITMNIYNDKTQNLYIYIGGPNVESFYANGNYYSVTSDEYYTVDIGKIQKGDIPIKINLSSNSSSSIKFYAYSINDELFKDFYNKINDNKLSVSKYSETMIEGSINTSNDMSMFTTIAYDKGWNVYVDNKKVDTYKIANSYMGFDIAKGHHKIKMVYYPVNMRKGLIISGISILVIILSILIHKKIIRKDEFSV